MYYDNQQIEARRIEIARCYVETNSTVRKVADELGFSKSTIHKNLIEFIEKSYVDLDQQQLAIKVRHLLDKNKQERHLRGGNSTKQKFIILKLQQE